MEKREDALREALLKNEEEIQRWEAYVKENETAVNNLEMFSKKLTVDVMVPIGRKALMPGRLIHTNEVMMGHYQDYFSQCSAYTATEICKKRIENGKQYLEKLETERDLFQNKLEKPYLDGVLPSSEEREIIEPYDEEKEKIWREDHRRRVKESKLKEKQEREAELSKEIINKNDLIKEMEEKELLDELNDELAELDIEPSNEETEEILNKLMSGEMKLPAPKKRKAHDAAKERDGYVHLKAIETTPNKSAEKIVEDMNSFVSDPKPKSLDSEAARDGDDSDASVGSDTPEEIRLLEKQAEYLPDSDRLGFFRYQLQIINQKLATFSFTNNKEMEEKIRLFRVREDLEELIEMHAEPALSDTDSQAADLEKEEETKVITQVQPKRRISFALEDKTIEFRKNETVAEMMPNKSVKEENPQRDVIQLDLPLLAESEQQCNKCIDRRKTIEQKVEEDFRNRDLGNVNLVDKIIESSMSRTLHIRFKHSPQSAATCSSEKSDTPSTPADLYRLACEPSEIPVTDNKNLNLKEIDRDRAYVDERSEFSLPPASEQVCEDAQSKSILKNKSAVDREKHIIPPVEKTKASKKQPRKPKSDNDLLSAYNQVMGDVCENESPLMAPDPLPEGRFVDAHIPKKRISRFKQMRNENK